MKFKIIAISIKSIHLLDIQKIDEIINEAKLYVDILRVEQKFTFIALKKLKNESSPQMAEHIERMSKYFDNISSLMSRLNDNIYNLKNRKEAIGSNHTDRQVDSMYKFLNDNHQCKHEASCLLSLDHNNSSEKNAIESAINGYIEESAEEYKTFKKEKVELNDAIIKERFGVLAKFLESSNLQEKDINDKLKQLNMAKQVVELIMSEMMDVIKEAYKKGTIDKEQLETYTQQIALKYMPLIDRVDAGIKKLTSYLTNRLDSETTSAYERIVLNADAKLATLASQLEFLQEIQEKRKSPELEVYIDKLIDMGKMISRGKRVINAILKATKVDGVLTDKELHEITEMSGGELFNKSEDDLRKLLSGDGYKEFLGQNIAKYEKMFSELEKIVNNTGKSKRAELSSMLDRVRGLSKTLIAQRKKVLQVREAIIAQKNKEIQIILDSKLSDEDKELHISRINELYNVTLDSMAAAIKMIDNLLSNTEDMGEAILVEYAALLVKENSLNKTQQMQINQLEGLIGTIGELINELSNSELQRGISGNSTRIQNQKNQKNTLINLKKLEEKLMEQLKEKKRSELMSEKMVASSKPVASVFDDELPI